MKGFFAQTPFPCFCPLYLVYLVLKGERLFDVLLNAIFTLYLSGDCHICRVEGKGKAKNTRLTVFFGVKKSNFKIRFDFVRFI